MPHFMTAKHGQCQQKMKGLTSQTGGSVESKSIFYITDLHFTIVYCVVIKQRLECVTASIEETKLIHLRKRSSHLRKKKRKWIYWRGVIYNDVRGK